MWNWIKSRLGKSFGIDSQNRIPESLFRSSVLDSVSDGILVCDNNPDSNFILYANQSIQDFFNLNSSDIIGQNVSSLYQSICSEGDWRQLKQALATKEAKSITIPIIGGDEKHWITLHLDPLQDKQNDPTYIVLTQTDISDLKDTQLKLKVSNDKLHHSLSVQANQISEHESQMQALFQNALDSMILIDNNQCIVDANEPALELFGYDIDTLASISLDKLLLNLDIDSLQIDDSSSFSHKELEINGLVGVQANTNTIPLVGYVRRVQLNSQDFFILILRDLTNYKMTEQELQKSQSELEESVRRFNLATKAGGIGIWNWNFLTDDVEWDERMYEIYGLSPETCVPNYDTWKKAVLPEDAEAAETALAHAKDTLTQFNAEFRIQLPAGEVRWIRAAADIIFDSDSNTPIGMGGINIDITKEKNAQDFLRHESEIAQAANEAKSMFLANMSHEIRTPMNGVVGMLSLLSESDMTGEQHNMVRTIKDSALTLLHIINDILDFSKIEAGQMSLESVPVELPMVVERTLDVLGLQASKKGIDLYATYSANLPRVVMSDSVRLSQILLNIVGNAVKFTDGQNNTSGLVCIHAEYKANGASPQIEITVSDNGIGMTDEQMLKLFNAFTQADTSTTRLFGGTGLGLSITKTLLELMGGDIGVRSEYGVGSTFTIHIPFVEVENQPKHTDCEDMLGNKLLFVTNDKSLVEACKRTLKGYECETTFVSSFSRARFVLEYAENNYNPYNIIVLGPDVDLQKVAEELKGLKEVISSDYKFIRMTQNASPEESMQHTGLYPYACKPFKPSELINHIAIVTGKRTPEVLEDSNEQIEQTPVGSEMGLILVVDDQPTNRDVMKRQLNFLGFECEMAVHGQDALTKWQSKHFDLILTDCHMPVMDGYELALSVRNAEHQDRSLGHTPIIAITANALADASDQCLSSGMDDYLAKPVELKTLGGCVKKWLHISPRPERSNDAVIVDEVEEPIVEVENAEAKVEHEITRATDKPESPICMQSLEDILGTSDDDIVYPLLQGYWESVISDVEEIDRALEEEDEQKLQQLAHAAKGAARSAGAETIASTFEELQNTALEKDWPHLEKTVANGKTELDKLKSYLQEHSIIE
ncbi:ATP-binding protein [Vibrio marisflavi]|uniref:ATP-binding protein n=1 Tax=Vibrio marisflavi TaxID=1216040 RepID=UPI001F171E43|nr:ATP-binding protein [Vibrio marisflavi]